MSPGGGYASLSRGGRGRAPRTGRFPTAAISSDFERRPARPPSTRKDRPVKAGPAGGRRASGRRCAPRPAPDHGCGKIARFGHSRGEIASDDGCGQIASDRGCGQIASDRGCGQIASDRGCASPKGSRPRIGPDTCPIRVRAGRPAESPGPDIFRVFRLGHSESLAAAGRGGGGHITQS